MQDLSWRVAGALKASGVAPGDKVAILSANDPRAFACVFGIARLGAVWCPINPRNETAENRALLELFDCDCLIYHPAYAEMVGEIPLRVTRLAWTELAQVAGGTGGRRADRPAGRPRDARRHRRDDRPARRA